MKIAVICDSFKGSLNSIEVCAAVKAGLLKADKNFTVLSLPFADGGEGTSRCFYDILGGKKRKITVHDPLFRKIEAEYTVLPDGTAVIDAASASGLTLIGDRERETKKTSSLGCGEMICDAAENGAENIIVGLGGSATTDAGMGILYALGMRFYSDGKTELAPMGENMINVKSLEPTPFFSRFKNVRFTLACDVTNPLCGKNGAAYVFSPQKGAAKSDIELLDRGLRNMGEIFEKMSGEKILNLPGAGAAGGIAGGMAAFLNCTVKSGFEVLSDKTPLKETIRQSDAVITGEGRTDSQTYFGKLPKKVSEVAEKFGVPCLLLSGDIENGISAEKLGFCEMYKIRDGGLSLEFCMKNAASLLSEKAFEIGKNSKIINKQSGSI
ncbi:MAG TPA: glycerate kinase [Ruminococcaceae bacterium]|nr:glycerate kinase [Oscillospiraceae bacterium]